jgi:nicotinamidase-related amidase
VDCHDEDHISFKDNKEAHMKKMEKDADKKVHEDAIRYQSHCVKGTWGQKIIRDLRLLPLVVEKINNNTAHLIVKGNISDKEGYSAFFKGKGITGHEPAPGRAGFKYSQLTTGLDAQLQKLGIKRLYLCGVAQNICVCDTARDALELGYEVVFVNDACKPLILPDDWYTKDIQSPENTLASLRALGVIGRDVARVDWNVDDEDLSTAKVSKLYEQWRDRKPVRDEVREDTKEYQESVAHWDGN